MSPVRIPPGPSTSPSAPAGSVTAANLLTAEVIPLDPTYQTAVEVPEGVGRTTNQSYVCLPDDGLASLGATAMVTRNFRAEVIDNEIDPYPKSPLKNQPMVYTQALQFADAAAATPARARYVGWIKACPNTLVEKGYSVDTGQSLKATAIDVEGGKADAGMVAYVKPGGTNAELLYWESAAVTQVKDRLMVTVTLSWGEDTPGTFDTTDGDFIHPQVILAEESTVEPPRRPQVLGLSIAPSRSRLSREMVSSGMPLGHTAVHSPMLVQPPKPSSSCWWTMPTTRDLRSG